jgi:hypothetical protein
MITDMLTVVSFTFTFGEKAYEKSLRYDVDGVVARFGGLPS